MGELDRELSPAGTEAIEIDPVGDPGEDSEVISLMLESFPVVELGTLTTGSSMESPTSSSVILKFGSLKVLFFS